MKGHIGMSGTMWTEGHTGMKGVNGLNGLRRCLPAKSTDVRHVLMTRSPVLTSHVAAVGILRQGPKGMSPGLASSILSLMMEILMLLSTF